MKNQKHLFNLPNNQIYLNGAYMSPQLKSVEAIGIQNLQRKSNPGAIKPTDFFTGQVLLKEAFSTLINAPSPEQIAIIPSVSYGISTVAQNIPLKKGDEILVIDEQFPSNIYPWQFHAKRAAAKVITITPPSSFEDRGQRWNNAIINAINPSTKVIALPQIHWADGTFFDLQMISEQARIIGAYFIIDGTQSVGAFPFDIASIKPDALVCGGYKWLMGPYSLGVAYYSKRMLNGDPIEHNWMNRFESENFSNLTEYQENYQPGAQRFSVGESSNFVYVPMLTEAVNQLIKWGANNIQDYCSNITTEGVQRLISSGYIIEDQDWRSNHLIGVYLPPNKDLVKIKAALTAKNIVISIRGQAIRVSPNVYNTKGDFDAFVDILCNV